MDPLASSFPGYTPYHYVHNNPINMIDPSGMSASAPIFGKDGSLLGTDDEGWTGEAIVMDAANFEQGMAHSDAVEGGTELGSYTEGIRISGDDWATVAENGGTVMTPSITNNSDFSVPYKPETTQNGQENAGAYSLGPRQDLYSAIDGVAAPHVQSGSVFKVVTGASVTITNTDVTAATNGTKQAVGQWLKGGWKGPEWRSTISTPVPAQTFPPCCGGSRAGVSPARPGDTSWNALYKKSR